MICNQISVQKQVINYNKVNLTATQGYCLKRNKHSADSKSLHAEVIADNQYVQATSCPQDPHLYLCQGSQQFCCAACHNGTHNLTKKSRLLTVLHVQAKLNKCMPWHFTVEREKITKCSICIIMPKPSLPPCNTAQST